MGGWWEALTGARCPGCGGPLDQPTLCQACRQALVPRHALGLVYLGGYQRFGGLARAVKYRGHLELAALLSQRLALGVRQAGWVLAGVTAVPTLWSRRLVRGYNQAELLAQALAQALGVPYQSVLRRVRGGPSQAHKTLRQRLLLPPGTFQPLRRVEGPWLLVDDVLTSGATWGQARRALLEAGASRVYGAAIAVKRPHQLAPYFL
ncbi:ComF family protein [Meiothermus rufus]|uniref:ComF family protein n=1 Tax=Meiothermus rufus TaxID=604332 RepID=UPI000402EF40|nr:ComF family protein [Meiothermus rufus]